METPTIYGDRRVDVVTRLHVEPAAQAMGANDVANVDSYVMAISPRIEPWDLAPNLSYTGYAAGSGIEVAVEKILKKDPHIIRLTRSVRLLVLRDVAIRVLQPNASRTAWELCEFRELGCVWDSFCPTILGPADFVEESLHSLGGYPAADLAGAIDVLIDCGMKLTEAANRGPDVSVCVAAESLTTLTHHAVHSYLDYSLGKKEKKPIPLHFGDLIYWLLIAQRQWTTADDLVSVVFDTDFGRISPKAAKGETAVQL